MNNNKNIVTSVETSEKLFKHLKDKIDTTFYWALSPMGWLLLYSVHNGFIDINGRWFARDNFEEFYPAYLVSELNAMLPDFIGAEHLYTLQYSRNWAKKDFQEHHLCYWHAGHDYLVSEYHDILVEVYAKVVLFVKENNYKLEHERR